jgi:hypothetical protein
MKTLHTNFKLNAGDISLTVTLGNGQRGNTLVAVGTQVLMNGPEITGLRIGPGSELAGQTLNVISTVSETNTNADAVITYQLYGGAEDRDYPLEDDFADGEVQIQFVATFDLVPGT